MRYTRLICRVAREVIEGGAELGVRLSPILLEAAEAAQLIEDAHEIFGRKIHVAAFIPEAEDVSTENICVSGRQGAGEERVAEQATRWRNTIAPEEGEHVLYIAARRHGKAGGLEDTLMPVDEQRLRQGFIDWAQGDGAAALPPGFAEAFISAGIPSRTSARALCEYATAYLTRVEEDPDWALAGELLPALSLPRDTGLNEEDASARLGANVTWASSAAMGERRGVKLRGAEAKALFAALERAIARMSTASASELSGVDLGELETSTLAGRSSSRRKKRSKKKTTASASTTRESSASTSSQAGEEPPSTSSETKKTKKTKKTRRRTSKAQKKAAQARQLSAGFLTPPQPRGGGRAVATSSHAGEPERERSASRGGAEVPRGAMLGGQAPNTPTPTATEDEIARGPVDARVSGVEEPAHAAWTESMQAREFGGVGSLPDGLYELLHASLANPTGEGLRWRVNSGPLRPLLERVSKALEPPEPITPDLGGGGLAALEHWRSKRRELAQALLAGPLNRARFVQVVNAPLLAMGDADLRAKARALVSASAALYRHVSDQADLNRDERARVLELDTIRVDADDGQRLLVLGPLHPLILGQVLARYDALQDAYEASSNIRSVLARSLLQAPVTPPRWPLSDGAELSLSRHDQGITLYESSPVDASDEDVELASELLLRKYLELHPHARVGVTVALKGGSPAPTLEGFARVLEQEEGVNLDAFIEVNTDGIARKRASKLIDAGRVRLRAMPERLDRVKPHLVIQLNPSRLKAEGILTTSDAPGAQYTGGVGALQPTFELVGEGLVTRTSVEGVEGVEEAEALLAITQGRAPQKLFILSEAAARLGAVFPEGTGQELTWQATISASISRRPRQGATLLVYEDVGEDARVAVVTASRRPLVRVLRRALRNIGVEDMRDRVLLSIAESLSFANTKGLISLNYSDTQSLAAALLALWLRVKMVDTRGVVAPIEGVHAATLLGLDEERSQGAFALAAHWYGGKLHVQVGYAALAAPMELTRRGNKLGGDLHTRLGRLLEVTQRALAGGDDLSARAAREAISWLLWPALAAELYQPTALINVLRELERGCEVVFTVRILLPRGHEAIAADASNTLLGAPVEVVGVDVGWMDTLIMNAQGALW